MLKQEFEKVKQNVRVLRVWLHEKGLQTQGMSNQVVIDRVHDSLCEGRGFVDVHIPGRGCAVCERLR